MAYKLKDIYCEFMTLVESLIGSISIALHMKEEAIHESGE